MNKDQNGKKTSKKEDLASSAKVALLEEKIHFLEKYIEDKDKQIHFLNNELVNKTCFELGIKEMSTTLEILRSQIVVKDELNSTLQRENETTKIRFKVMEEFFYKHLQIIADNPPSPRK